MWTVVSSGILSREDCTRRRERPREATSRDRRRWNPQPPGFIAHATLMDNLLNGEAMRETPAWLAVVLILIDGAFGSIVQWKSLRFAWRPACDGR